jgi:hypothetical protein
MIFEYYTAAPEVGDADPYLNLMDVEGWELVRFDPVPFSAFGGFQVLRVLILHRRPVEAEREAAHIARVRQKKKAA